MNSVFVIKILCIGGLLKEYHMLVEREREREIFLRLTRMTDTSP